MVYYVSVRRILRPSVVNSSLEYFITLKKSRNPYIASSIVTLEGKEDGGKGRGDNIFSKGNSRSIIYNTQYIMIYDTIYKTVSHILEGKRMHRDEIASFLKIFCYIM